MVAEKWGREITQIPISNEFETLDIKFGKALRSTVKGDDKRELQNLEERVLREQERLLGGCEIYAWINGKFNRNATLARPQILTEIANCRIGNERNALRIFMAKWDAAVERLIQTGVTHDDDQLILYMNFKPSFMNCPDLSEHAAKVRRSLPSSKVHSYKWMYRAAKARLETVN